MYTTGTDDSQPKQGFSERSFAPDASSNDLEVPTPNYPGCNFYPADFINVLETCIQNVINEHTSGSLLLVSVNNLSMIINAYGHDTSEIVFHDLSKSIESMLQEGDVIQRLQRDQLGIILMNSSAEEAALLAQRIHNNIQNFGRDNVATASLHLIGVIGSVNFPMESTSAHDALDKVYVAVSSPHTSPHRTLDMTKRDAEQARQQMGLANYLLKAYKEKRLRLAYQPVIRSTTGETAHYEALLRLVNPSGKITSAGALIPVAEKMGLIDIIDTMVMQMVIEELHHSPNISLAFNVSNNTTENVLWLDTINNLLKDRPDIASRLIVEITETAIHRDLRRTAYFVASLQSLGCSVALDDFGSGYTSFRQLKALSVDMVKIDGVFIKDLAQSADNQFFVKTLLDFAKGFGLETVAEYVETGEIAKILMGLGVDSMQGYYFGKPENHRSWLNEGEYKSE
ncbi:MAG: EAL domain-containing protein [Rickettsiales bacterium]|jgi:diguanylate cyclase (GGDEF)-like protein|nr:EAL domain-containing protein [Rickettsiales bacterium]